jgi:hypothetical protein
MPSQPVAPRSSSAAQEPPTAAATSTATMADKVREIRDKAETKWRRFINDRDPKINKASALRALLAR